MGIQLFSLTQILWSQNHENHSTSNTTPLPMPHLGKSVGKGQIIDLRESYTCGLDSRSACSGVPKKSLAVGANYISIHLITLLVISSSLLSRPHVLPYFVGLCHSCTSYYLTPMRNKCEEIQKRF